ncbi:sulfotransferase [Agarivorans sp. B2Z047]|uniref:sulfotransferase n=1 Tax=Agarivorans sp. B2Z047 TaxID=2652721 RepID=UPI00128B514C|nr:sulfotransferase [Agarivorans sp. B2Z047]MPW28662.1 sulfotransferase [Agarivorans sp. B2Z047]UQN41223.1 sulfotransferase [Agarivorans sp. B2Z047]
MEDNKRSLRFKRNSNLEESIQALSEILSLIPRPVENNQNHPIIFVLGGLRSGTTLLTQYLYSTKSIYTPNNFLSRFYSNPLVGAKIQKILFDENYRFGNEFDDLPTFKNSNFKSENGKTHGALSPNEFWYFWRRFVTDNDYSLTQNQLTNKLINSSFKDELIALSNELNTPLVLKAMNLNHNFLPLLDVFKKSFFVYVRRDIYSQTNSIINARIRQYGDSKTWYSFPIPYFEKIAKEPIATQAAFQALIINRNIETQLSQIPKENFIQIDYEKFCQEPRWLVDKLAAQLKMKYDFELEINTSDLEQIFNESRLSPSSYNKLAPSIKRAKEILAKCN